MHARAIEGDDGRFEPDLAFPAVQNDAHGITQLIAHVFCARRGEPPVAIGGRCCNPAAKGREQLLRHRMRGHADRDRILTAGEDVVHVGCTRQHHGQRPGPKALSEPRRSFRHFAHPAVQEARTINVNDDRMGRGPALRLKNLAHGGGVLRIRAQAVHRLRGERDQLPVAQRLHGSLYFNLGCPDHFNHGEDSTKAEPHCLCAAPPTARAQVYSSAWRSQPAGVRLSSYAGQ